MRCPAAPADPDQALVQRARRGDAEAFGDLVRAYQHRIVNFTRALVSDAADAEDVAQDAFLRAYRGLGGFRGGSSFKTWMYQIALNAARTHLARRRDRPEQAAGDPAATPEAFGQPTTGEDVEASVIRRDRLDRALQALPEDLRVAVVLRDVEGLDYGRWRARWTCRWAPSSRESSAAGRGCARSSRIRTGGAGTPWRIVMITKACQEFESRLVRAADGALDAGDQIALDAHLHVCGACRAALADQRAVRQALAARPTLRAQPDFASRVAAAIEADRSWLDRLDFRAWTWRLVPVAAALSFVTWMVVRGAATAATPGPTSTRRRDRRGLACGRRALGPVGLRHRRALADAAGQRERQAGRFL